MATGRSALGSWSGPPFLPGAEPGHPTRPFPIPLRGPENRDPQTSRPRCEIWKIGSGLEGNLGVCWLSAGSYLLRSLGVLGTAEGAPPGPQRVEAGASPGPSVAPGEGLRLPEETCSQRGGSLFTEMRRPCQ